MLLKKISILNIILKKKLYKLLFFIILVLFYLNKIVKKNIYNYIIIFIILNM